MAYPDKLRKGEVLPPTAAITSEKGWQKELHAVFSRYKKAVHKYASAKKTADAADFDYTDALVKRRQSAILRYLPELYERYPAPAENQPSIGRLWIELNAVLSTYGDMDIRDHVLHAAAIWILDQVTNRENWRDIYRLLPTDESVMEELYRHDAWVAGYDYDLIYSVEYVLCHRNPVEKGRFPRVITSEYLAAGKRKNDEPTRDRANYEALMAMVPQEAVDAAVAQFKSCFWQWVDRFYENAAPFIRAEIDADRRYRESQVALNELIDAFNAALDEAAKQRKKGGGRPADSLAVTVNAPVPRFTPTLRDAPFSGVIPMTERERTAADIYGLNDRIERAYEEMDRRMEQANDAYRDCTDYCVFMADRGRFFGDETEEHGDCWPQAMTPLTIDDPFALCFALLYLAERDDDLPWLYGACQGLMCEVAEALPWGIMEYDELEDEAWDDGQRPPLPKTVVIPDFYRRSYRAKGDVLPRSLAQILYEETGCLLPHDLHVYDGRAAALTKYGLRGKDAAALLVLMSALGTIRRGASALNLDSEMMAFMDGDMEGDMPETAPKEDAQALKAEIKRLRGALHTADKESREAKKALAEAKDAAAREHRELADLREYVFHAADAPEEPEAVEEADWPYEVRRDTVVFGGHATWAKGIRGLLTGNVRFVDKDLLFDTGLVRRAETIWIQPNAISHPMYWRVVDTARAYNKPVRYFAFASWAKCARQVADGDK